MPSDERVGKSITYLVETDEPLAVLRAEKDAAEYLLKHHKARLGLESGEKAASAQENQAFASDEYKQLIEDLRQISAEFYTMEAKRKTEALIVDIWRSFSANTRKGNI
tara:strand:+ start:3710 stop:4033 length:324 start_codon:yes stop_codon:yes gene_type:complete